MKYLELSPYINNRLSVSLAIRVNLNLEGAAYTHPGLAQPRQPTTFAFWITSETRE